MGCIRAWEPIAILEFDGLGFWNFALACAPPALAGLAIVYATVRIVWRKELAKLDLGMERLPVLAVFSLLASNSIGNVPAVMLLLSISPELSTGALYALAVLSTLAGNLFLVGSIANIIVAERAAAAGARFGFRDHARAGVPMTLISFGVAGAWLLAAGYVGG